MGDAHNGLFLAAPRRTGKSTFLQGDLTPALQQAGVEVVYVDLWADTRRDPGTLDIDTSKIGQVDGLTESGVLARAVTPCHYDDQAAPGSTGSRS